MLTKIKIFVLQSLEPVTASLLPIPILLLGGLFGRSFIERHQNTAFLLVLSLSAVGIFFSELLWQLHIRRRYVRQLQKAQSTCQSYLQGDRMLRLSLQGNSLFRPLLETVNTLLDTMITPEKYQQMTSKEQVLQMEVGETRANMRIAQDYATQLTKQLQKLLHTFTIARQGNLQVRAQPPGGEVGQLADFCNAMLEELAIVIQWARESSQQVQGATDTFLESVVELTQTTEIHLYGLTSTTEALGTLVSFLQRLGGTLSPCLERIQRAQALLAHKENGWLTLQDEMSDLAQLVAELLHGTQIQVVHAESLYEELSALSQQLAYASSPLFALTEQITLLSGQAHAWSQAMSIYQIPAQKHPSAPVTPVTPPHSWEEQSEWVQAFL